MEALIMFALAILVLFAWISSIDLLIKAGQAKGYSMEGTGKLWIIGLFASPIVLGLYICALPDNRKIPEASSKAAKVTDADAVTTPDENNSHVPTPVG